MSCRCCSRLVCHVLLAAAAWSCVAAQRSALEPEPALREASALPPRRAAIDYPWLPDLGDGTYQNPVIFGDYSDPDVIRVGADYYMVASSFNATPGLPILHSRDLVNWSLVGHALENLPDARYAEVQPGAGIWAPALREHAGKFHIFAPTPDEGIYVLSASDPRGPWSTPRMLLAGKGLIDPCPLWDDDGKAYLVHAYARSRAGIKDRLRVRPMAPDASAVLGEGQIVYFDPEHQPTLEGPKFYKINGWYLILAPAGGVTGGWQLALRSRSVYGPYEARVVLEQGATSINGPHQGALVDTASGAHWFVHFQDQGLYGRVVHLNPVTWHEGWPLMGVPGSVPTEREPLWRAKKPVPAQPALAPATSDDFQADALGLQWQWHANHRREWWSLSERPGFLRLYSRGVSESTLEREPNLLLQKLPARAFSVETQVELGEPNAKVKAGMVVLGKRSAAFGIEVAAEGSCIFLDIASERAACTPAARGPVSLVVTMADGGLCHFRYRLAGGETQSLEPWFQAEPGQWIGAKLGLFALSADAAAPVSYADFDYFRWTPP